MYLKQLNKTRKVQQSGRLSAKQHSFIDELYTKLNFKSLDDWYTINNKKFIKHGGGGLLNKCKGSLLKVLQEHYPLHPWDEFERKSLSKNFWKSKDNQRLFFDKLYQKLGLKSLDDWIPINNTEIIQNGGGTIINMYNGQLITALKELYPHHSWSILQIKKTKFFWDDKENVSHFLSKIYEKYNLQCMEDWYQIKQNDIKENGGTGLLKKYQGSLFKVLKETYPNYVWDIALSSCKGRWDEFDCRNLSLKIQKQFFIRSKDDWYRISQKHIASLLPNRKSKHLNYQSLNILKILAKVHPDQQFNQYLLRTRLKKASQRSLWAVIQHIFINHSILEEFIHPSVHFKTGANFRFDIFIPSLLLALEYQGEQHFDDSPNVFSNIEVYQTRDAEKQRICEMKGIIVISVPFWWDESPDQMKSTIINQLLRYCSK